MFTIQHLIWAIISAFVIVFSLIGIKKKELNLKQVLNIACIVCVVSELVKTFSAIEIVPSADGSVYYPYIQMQHMPFHLCSLQIITIFLARFGKEGEWKKKLLGFIYPTSIIGALLAIAMPTVFSNCVDISQAFTHPWVYQFFFYHSMLVVLGIYLGSSKEADLKWEYAKTTLIILCVCAFFSLYINSMLASPVYENGQLISVEYATNFFFTYKVVLNIPLTEKWHWALYILILLIIAIAAIYLMYLPIKIRNEKQAEKADKVIV